MEQYLLSSIPRTWIFAGYGELLSLFHTPALDFRRVWSSTCSLPYPGFGFSQGMEQYLLSSIPRSWIFAGYGAVFTLFHTPALDFRGVWRTTFSLLYPALGLSEIYWAGNIFSSVKFLLRTSKIQPFRVCRAFFFLERNKHRFAIIESIQLPHNRLFGCNIQVSF